MGEGSCPDSSLYRPISDAEPLATRLAYATFHPYALRLMKWRLLFVALVFGVDCTTSNVKPLGPPMPARLIGCAVAFFSQTPPPYEYVDIASVRARCRYSTDRIGCEDDLRAKACALGGDTVYGFARAATRDHTLVSAKVAYRRKRAADVAAGPALCTPACGAGQKCEDGECVPACSPNCGSPNVCGPGKSCGSFGKAVETETATAPVSPLPPTLDPPTVAP